MARAFAQVQVDRRADWTPAGAFSGGNQQKIAIAKWLVAQSRILLLFDPTRGIDVGTKHELYLLMRRYVEGGRSCSIPPRSPKSCTCATARWCCTAAACRPSWRARR